MGAKASASAQAMKHHDRRGRRSHSRVATIVVELSVGDGAW